MHLLGATSLSVVRSADPGVVYTPACYIVVVGLDWLLALSGEQAGIG